MDSKILAFEYVVKRLIEWFDEVNSEKGLNALDAFSKLKLIKLHFFVSAVDANKDQEGLLKTFNNFYAMPYGHVESDVYSRLNETEFYSIGNNSISKKPVLAESKLSPNVKREIDISVDKLKEINPDLINYTAFQLVEISHKWYSWKKTFEEAKRQNRHSGKIDPDTIRFEPKFFN